MAIINPRLVVEPTTQRYKAEVSCVTITNAIPPSDRVYLDNGVRVLVSQAPRFEGEAIVYRDGSLVQMYVVVDISGTLTWKQVKMVTEYRDSATGKTFRSL